VILYVTLVLIFNFPKNTQVNSTMPYYPAPVTNNNGIPNSAVQYPAGPYTEQVHSPGHLVDGAMNTTDQQPGAYSEQQHSSSSNEAAGASPNNSTDVSLNTTPPQRQQGVLDGPNGEKQDGPPLACPQASSPKFPIDEAKARAIFNRVGRKMTLFTSKLMEYVFGIAYLKTHKMTSQKDDKSDKTAADSDHIDQLTGT
jgi:hypothetical protein